MGYRKEAIKGFSWVGALRISTRVASLVRTLVLGRILVPAQFGLFGIALLVLAFLEIFTETGINIFLLQEKEDADEYVNTAWVVSILRGFLIALLLYVSAPYVSAFFRTPDALSLLRLIAVVPFLRGFINPSVIKFQKELQFRKDFVYRLMIFVVDVTVAITAAIVTSSAASVIYGLIAGVVVELVFSYAWARPRPSLVFEKEKFLEVVHRGKWFTGAGIFQYLFREGDDIVVGRVLDSTALGFYQMAYKIATLPISEVADVVGKVTLPIYVKFSDDKARLWRALVQTTLFVVAITAPFSLLLVFFSGDLVGVVLGEKWLPAVTAIQVVSIYSFLRAIINPSLTMFLAIKRHQYVTWITMVGIMAMGASILPLVYRYGIVGAGASTIVGVLFTFPFVTYYLVKVFK